MTKLDWLQKWFDTHNQEDQPTQPSATGTVDSTRLREHMESAEFEVGGGMRRFKVRAGYYAVADFSASSVDAVEVLLRAGTALRHGRTSAAPRGISAYEEVPGRLVH